MKRNDLLRAELLEKLPQEFHRCWLRQRLTVMDMGLIIFIIAVGALIVWVWGQT